MAEGGKKMLNETKINNKFYVYERKELGDWKANNLNNNYLNDNETRDVFVKNDTIHKTKKTKKSTKKESSENEDFSDIGNDICSQEYKKEVIN